MSARTIRQKSPIGQWGRRCRKVLLLLFPLFTTHPVTAAVFTVNSIVDARDTVPGDGACTTSAGACSLRAAIEETNALPGPDSVNIPTGSYSITLGNGDDDAERGDFDVTDTLTIAGSGQTSTTIDGNASDRVFDVHESASLDMSAVTIRNGNINSQGGGIRSEGTLTLTNVTISDNIGKDGGGVSVRKNGSTATFTRVTFLRNSADKGGGLHAKDSTVVSVSDTTFAENTASKDGGGAYFEKGISTITDSVFDRNTAKKGSGLFVKNVTSSTTSDSSFSSNNASAEGGGIYFDKVNATITRSVVSSNNADEGGGVFIKGNNSVVAIENVTLSGNSAGKAGGGLQKEGNGRTSLVNVTLYGNGSPNGGGLHVKDGTLRAMNTIVANSSQGLDCEGTVTSLGNNLGSDGSCQLNQPGDLANTDPLVGPLQNNGGPTLTHALLFSSPARDAGSNSGSPATDQRGQPRPVDGDADGLAMCDIGAYEALPMYPDYSLQKSVTALSDPYSGASDPKAIPGAVMQYAIQLGNAGPGAADEDSIVITEAVPPDTALVVTDFDATNPGPVSFVDGSPASGLSYSFISLGNTTDDIEFSEDNGVTYSYVPSPGTDGSDPSVTHIRLTLKGTATFTGADPVAEFDFKVVVR